MAEMRTPNTGSIFKYKLVFVGDQSVGKTSIINRFIYDTFSGYDQPTVGIDFVSKTIHMDNKTIRLQLWDTAGQERFRSLIPSYIRDSNAAIIVYDISNPVSFQNINKWVEYVRDERGDDVVIALVGNKIDSVEKRAVSLEEGEKKGKETNVSFFEVSAKTGQNIAVLFKNLTSMLQGTDSSSAATFSSPNGPAGSQNGGQGGFTVSNKSTKDGVNTPASGGKCC